jgi:hypothetical protein
MAIYDQVSRHDGYIDITVYSATAISAGYAVEWTTVTGQPFAVQLVTDGGGSEAFAGITTTNIVAGGYGTICILGPCVAVAKELITQGTIVRASDATGHMGKMIKLVKTGNLEAVRVVGTCIQASTADTDYFEILVAPSCVTTDAP